MALVPQGLLPRVGGNEPFFFTSSPTGSPSITLVPGSASIVLSPNPIVSAGSIDTAQNITTTADPTFDGVTLTGLSANAIVKTDGSSKLASQTLADGQLIIGKSGLAPVAATLTAASGVLITSGSGSIAVGANEYYQKSQVSISYSTGTVGQSGTTVTGAGGATFTSSMIGGVIAFATFQTAFITAVPSSSTLTVTPSQTVAGGTIYNIWYGADQATQGYYGAKGANFSDLAAAAIIRTDANKNITATALTNGQLLIGSFGAAPVAASITAGSGVSVTGGAGSITVANTDPGSAILPINLAGGGSEVTGLLPAANISLSGVTLGSSGRLVTDNGFSVVTERVLSSHPITTQEGGTGLSNTPTDGSTLIASGGAYVSANLTAGAGITITSVAGSITIASSGTGFNATEYTTNGSYTYNIPSGAKFLRILGVGAGGGSGGGFKSTNIVAGAGGGGGAGTYRLLTVLVGAATTAAIVVGQGGSAGSGGVSATSGGAGTASTVTINGQVIYFAAGGGGGPGTSTAGGGGGGSGGANDGGSTTTSTAGAAGSSTPPGGTNYHVGLAGLTGGTGRSGTGGAGNPGNGGANMTTDFIVAGGAGGGAALAANTSGAGGDSQGAAFTGGVAGTSSGNITSGAGGGASYLANGGNGGDGLSSAPNGVAGTKGSGAGGGAGGLNSATPGNGALGGDGYFYIQPY